MNVARDLRYALDPVLFAREALGLVPDPWQETLLETDHPRVVVNVARQCGKSTMTGAKALHGALFRAPLTVLMVSPSLRQSGELFKKLVGFWQRMPDAPEATALSETRIEFSSGSRVVSLPGSETTTRSYTAGLVIVDEASRVSDDIYGSIRPALATTGGQLILPSTPFGRRGFFFEAFENGRDWMRLRVTAAECPRISAAFLEKERSEIGDWRFRQEYLCEFVDSDEQLFDGALIERALSHDVTPLNLAA